MESRVRILQRSLLIFRCCEWQIKISAFASLLFWTLLLSCWDFYDRLDDVLRLELLLHLLANHKESLLHALTCLCTHFVKEYFAVGSWVFLGHCDSLFRCDYSCTVLEVFLVGEDYFRDSGRCFFRDLMDPCIEVIKGRAISYRVSQDDARSTFVVCLSDGTISLLTSCIPDLQFHFLAL